ncbi:DDE-type integrase/transposase/recombinase [Neptunomonas qingdaonensis]|uniref:Putative transposase n=1 Tax=Neptunomonas qingdaonensis TaxID=1045558 RepID=A0A1I2MFV1_9GAMM|nr:DDE-type integrase/transposase/recombinase [Neptunomonas qingdaonensis]SFF89649.1 putative transposase [Neptunomonas qingdaonensis]
MTNGYKIGDFIVVSNDVVEKQFEIVGVDGNLIRLVDAFNLIASTRTIIELNELVLKGSAKILPKSQKERDFKDPWSLDFSGYSENDKSEARRRYRYICAASEVKSFTSEYLDPIREAVAIELSEVPPSARTIARWQKSYIEAGCSIKGLLPSTKKKGNRSPKVSKTAEIHIQDAIDHYKQSMSPSFSSSHDYMKTKIHYENRLVTDDQKLRVPTLPTFIKRVKKEAPAKVLEARQGKRAAMIAFKQSKPVREVKLILQRAEVDHTRLDLFVVDSETRMVLGRPWITVFLDYKSKSILGFNIGFEDPSYLSVARALHHAMSSKAYVKERYPSVVNDWLCAGVPAVIATDRGKEFTSVAFEDACMDFHVTIQHNPGKHPWYKGSIESYFRAMNQKLLNDKQGRTMGRMAEVIDYIPEKNAIISMSTFLEMFHIWVIDIYQCDTVAGGKLIPNEEWKKDLEIVPIYPVDPIRSNIVLAESFEVTITNLGITKDSILYDDQHLTKYRMKHGFGRMRIKRNRDDLGYIYVYNEHEEKYFKVAAVDQKYASGLTAYQHRTNKKFVRNILKKKVDLEALAVAKMKIIQLVENEFSLSLKNKISTKARVARYMEIGQQKEGGVKASVLDEAASQNQGVPKPAEQPAKGSSTVPESDFDGTDNDYPEELEF